MITFEASDNAAYVNVPAMSFGDPAITIQIWQCGVDRSWGEQRAQFAYVIRIDGVAGVRGEDLRGPNTGLWPEAEDMAVTLAAFCGTADAEDAVYCGWSASDAAFLAPHAERLSSWAAMREDAQN